MTWINTEEAARRLSLSRSQLGALADLAPPELPGAPVNASMGQRNASYRWRSDQLDEWFVALGQWRREVAQLGAEAARRALVERANQGRVAVAAVLERHTPRRRAPSEAAHQEPGGSLLGQAEVAYRRRSKK